MPLETQVKNTLVKETLDNLKNILLTFFYKWQKIDHVYEVNKTINSIFYLCPPFLLSTCFTSLYPDHKSSQDTCQEEAFDSCYRCKQSSAGLGWREVQACQLLETQDAAKCKFSFLLTSPPKKPTKTQILWLLWFILWTPSWRLVALRATVKALEWLF